MSAATGKVKKLLQAFRKAFKAYEKNPKSNSLKVKCEDSLASIKVGRVLVENPNIAMLDFDIEGTLETDAKSAKEQIILLRNLLLLFVCLSTNKAGGVRRSLQGLCLIFIPHPQARPSSSRHS
eukprot:1374147-Amorphochlora_amoeboformis.AAC.1